MSEQPPTYEKAWNPLTFRGLSQFASSKLPRLLLVEFFFALLLFTAVVWFVAANYAPIIVTAIHQFPETARLENGELKGIDTRIEAEGKFLSITIDPNDLSDTGTGDVQFGFGNTNFVVCSVVSSSWGCLTFPYSTEPQDLKRSTVQPWWGARQPFIIAATGLGVAVAMFVALALIALVLMWIAMFVAYFADKHLTPYRAWKYAMAAQLPGVIVLAAAVFLYGSQAMDLLGVGIFYALHIVVDLVYLLGGIFFLPHISGAVTTNPFGTAKKSS